VQKYSTHTELKWLSKKECKQCALIAVDEMIEQNGELYLSGHLDRDVYTKRNGELFEIKSEIEKL